MAKQQEIRGGSSPKWYREWNRWSWWQRLSQTIRRAAGATDVKIEIVVTAQIPCPACGTVATRGASVEASRIGYSESGIDEAAKFLVKILEQGRSGNEEGRARP